MRLFTGVLLLLVGAPIYASDALDEPAPRTSAQVEPTPLSPTEALPICKLPIGGIIWSMTKRDLDAWAKKNLVRLHSDRDGQGAMILDGKIGQIPFNFVALNFQKRQFPGRLLILAVSYSAGAIDGSVLRQVLDDRYGEPSVLADGVASWKARTESGEPVLVSMIRGKDGRFSVLYRNMARAKREKYAEYQELLGVH